PVHGAPALSTRRSSDLTQGQANLPVTITGQNTHFTNAGLIDLGAGITASNVVATDATHLTAQLTLAANAATGLRNLTVTTGGERVGLHNAVTVQGAPAV